MSRQKSLLSYSHKDERWKGWLVSHLRVLERQGSLHVWDDRRIAAGRDWRAEIDTAMAKARVAVLLVSADFLTSDFLLDEEVPRLLLRRKSPSLHSSNNVCLFDIASNRWLGKVKAGRGDQAFDRDVAFSRDRSVAFVTDPPDRTLAANW